LNPDVFYQYWNHNFDQCPLLGYVLKYKFENNWIRIHNLPEAKRYATDDHEMEEILNRQNTLLAELADKVGTRIIIVTGEYLLKEDLSAKNHIAIAHEILRDYDFKILPSIDLYDQYPEFINENVFYRPAFALSEWQPQLHNALLKAIANDQLRAFFIFPVGKILFAPYDGGVDMIIFDEAKYNFIKKEFGMWLSSRPDGL
jgi:hypothetical protein